MRRKVCMLLFCMVIVLGITTGCGNSSKPKKEQKDSKLEEVLDSKIVGTWSLNRNVRVSDSKYNSLKALIGDSYSSDALEIHEDGTFRLSTGMLYNLKGKCKYQKNELSFYDIEDVNVKNEENLKDIEENLKLQYIEYEGNQFLKMYLYDMKDFEGYLFYEKDSKEKTGSYADDPVPEVKFQQDSKEENLENTKQSYLGTYQNSQGDTIEILLKNDGGLYLKNHNKECQIEMKDMNSSGVQEIASVSSLLEGVTSIYLYPKGVSFSLSDDPATYEEEETDRSKDRLFLKTEKESNLENVYYKK